MPFMKTKILITGSNSGLGRYLIESLGGVGWDLDTSKQVKAKLQKTGVEIIIHCAFNLSREITTDNLADYFSTNVLLTQELLKIPHQRFIFISTVDVYNSSKARISSSAYPKDKIKHKEDEVIDVNKVEGMYPITKLISEAMIKKGSKQYLILRCAAMLGKYSRKNSLIRLIEDPKPILTLTSNSEFNYVLHTDVGEFIQKAIEQNLTGIYNLTSTGDVKLSEVVRLLNKKKVKFGKFKYNGGKVNNKKALTVSPTFKKNSKQVIREFIQLLYKNQTLP